MLWLNFEWALHGGDGDDHVCLIISASLSEFTK